VFLTLLDTHISALIAALFLIQFGTGPIRLRVHPHHQAGLNLFTSTSSRKPCSSWRSDAQRQAATLSI
jgi:hypothetical protein